jgi:hypothetical protein
MHHVNPLPVLCMDVSSMLDQHFDHFAVAVKRCKVQSGKAVLATTW